MRIIGIGRLGRGTSHPRTNTSTKTARHGQTPRTKPPVGCFKPSWTL